MTVARRAAETLALIRTRVRDETGDTDTADPRYTDANIDRAVSDQLAEMANELAIKYPGEALLRVNLNYPGTNPVDLPAAVEAESIYRVDDVTNSQLAIQIEYVSPLEGDEWDPGYVPAGRRRFRYTLLGPTTDHRTYRIQLYPAPGSYGARTLRISYIASPYVFDGTAGDTQPFSPRWAELIGVGAAIRLMSRDEEATTQQMMRHMTLWQQFTSLSRRQRGPQRIRRRRRGIS